MSEEVIRWTCQQCGKKFETYHRKRVVKYCSMKCYGASIRKYPTQIIMECQYCHKLYSYPSIWSWQAKRSKYCSMKCCQLSKMKFETRECMVCHNPITKIPWKFKEHPRHVCSRKCQGILAQMDRLGKTYDELYGEEEASRKRTKLKMAWKPECHVPTEKARVIWREKFMGNKLREGLSPWNKGKSWNEGTLAKFFISHNRLNALPPEIIERFIQAKILQSKIRRSLNV